MAIQLLLGAPGSGKSTRAVAATQEMLASGGRALLLGFGREAVAQLREDLGVNGVRREPVARTFHGFAFSLLQKHHTDGPSPFLLSGAEQDLFIRRLLAEGGTTWPTTLLPALQSAGFAKELRDLLSRVVERNLSAHEFAAIGESANRPEWVSAAHFYSKYLAELAEARPGAIDPNALIVRAISLLKKDEDVLRQVRASFDTIIVDDFHEADPSQRTLLSLITQNSLVVTADPASAVGKFRGADPEGMIDALEELAKERQNALVIEVLTHQHRVTQEINQALESISNEIPRSDYSAGAQSARSGTPIRLENYSSSIDEATAVALWFQELHVMEGVSYRDMAVITRNSNTELFRIAFSALGIPIAQVPILSLAERSAVWPIFTLLTLADASLKADFDPQQFDLEIEELMLSIYGEADMFDIKRLNELRFREGYSATSLYELLNERSDTPSARISSYIEGVRKILSKPGGRADEILWKVWELLSNAGEPAAIWQKVALSGGRKGEAAHENLDSLIELIQNASRYTERKPRSRVMEFVREMQAQEFDADVIRPRRIERERVSIMSVHRARGREWRVVAIPSINGGAWPNLTPRGSLLGSEEFVELHNRSEAVRNSEILKLNASSALLIDERRLLHSAVGRCSEYLMLSAVTGEDSRPSRFFRDLHRALVASSDGNSGVISKVSDALSPETFISALRHRVTGEEAGLIRPVETTVERAAQILGFLSAAEVPGADLSRWYGYRDLSDNRPVAIEEEEIRLSPSSIDSFEKCQLRWLLTNNGGRRSDSKEQELGILIHKVAESLINPDVSNSQLEEIFESGLLAIDLGKGWVRSSYEKAARQMFTNLIAWHSSNKKKRELIAVEAQIDMHIGRVHLTGKIDRLESDEAGNTVVVDLKTAKNAISYVDAEKTYQLSAYQLAVSENGVRDLELAPPGGGELVYLGDSKLHTRPQSELGITEVKEALSEIALRMSGAFFEAQKSKECRTCPVKSSCPRMAAGSQVVDLS